MCFYCLFIAEDSFNVQISGNRALQNTSLWKHYVQLVPKGSYFCPKRKDVPVTISIEF